jgi:hypothetical protein
MPKSSKQKNKKGKLNENRSQQRQHKIPVIPSNPQFPLADLLESAKPEATDVLEVTIASEATVEAEPLLATKLTAAQELRASLLAKQQQAKQWKQQLKAGKMVGAHVPKRFNRGG